MAVSNTAVKQLYVADGAQTTFAIPFAFISGAGNDQIKVYLVSVTTGLLTAQTLGSDFTLDPEGDDPTNVIFTTAPAATYKVLVIREVSRQQILDYINTDWRYMAEDHETQMDRMVLMIQELYEMLSRTMLGSHLESGVDYYLPPISGDQILCVNEDADGFEWRNPSAIALLAANINGTDDLAEGATNLYFTHARVIAGDQQQQVLNNNTTDTIAGMVFSSAQVVRYTFEYVALRGTKRQSGLVTCVFSEGAWDYAHEAHGAVGVTFSVHATTGQASVASTDDVAGKFTYKLISTMAVEA